MKDILSVTAFLALLSALVSAAPLSRRGSSTYGADYFKVISAAVPNVDISPGGSNTAMISIINGSNETDTIVSFSIPPLRPNSTCQFYMSGVNPLPGGNSQLLQV